MSQTTLELIKDIIYLLPILGLIWKAATMASTIKQNVKDIEELKTVTKEQNVAILESLKQMNQALADIKTDVAVLKADKEKK